MLRGKIVSKSRRTWETVNAGAFFPQADFHMPQEEMRQHAREDVVMPPWVFAEFIMVHTQLRFSLCEALFHSPTYTTQPHQEAQGHTHWSIADVVPVGGVLPETSLHD